MYANNITSKFEGLVSYVQGVYRGFGVTQSQGGGEQDRPLPRARNYCELLSGCGSFFCDRVSTRGVTNQKKLFAALVVTAACFTFVSSWFTLGVALAAVVFFEKLIELIQRHSYWAAAIALIAVTVFLPFSTSIGLVLTAVAVYLGDTLIQGSLSEEL